MEPSSRVEIVQGTLDMLVLEVLKTEKLHGYAIREAITSRSENFLHVEEGSLYPCLYRMERRGWITSESGRSENNRPARYYSITRTGREELRRQHKSWEASVEAVNMVFLQKEK